MNVGCRAIYFFSPRFLFGNSAQLTKRKLCSISVQFCFPIMSLLLGDKSELPPSLGLADTPTRVNPIADVLVSLQISELKKKSKRIRKIAEKQKGGANCNAPIVHFTPPVNPSPTAFHQNAVLQPLGESWNRLVLGLLLCAPPLCPSSCAFLFRASCVADGMLAAGGCEHR